MRTAALPPSISSALRVSIVLVGVFMVVYCGGGFGASALQSGLQWIHGTLIAGVAAGLVLLVWSAKWTHPLAARAAVTALSMGVASAFLSIPAILVMSSLFGTRELDLYVGVVVPPFAFIGGMVLGGALVLLHGRGAAARARRRPPQGARRTSH